MANPTIKLPVVPIQMGLSGDDLISAVNDRLRRLAISGDQVASSLVNGSSPALDGILGNGLTLAIGKLEAAVTSGIGIDANGNIVLKNGSGIVIDQQGNVSVQPGVGLTINAQGFLQVNPGTGLTADQDGVYIPGGAITNSLLAALSVATANIQAGAVATGQIASGAVTTTKIANAAITNALIANLAVGTAQIQTGAITTALIANAAITSALIGSAAVGTANIQNGAITNALIANLAVGDANISAVAAGKISTGTLTVGGSGTNANVSILNASNVQIGWAGTDGGGNYGAWFKTCRVGGSGYSSAPLQADASGNVTLNGATVTVTGTTAPSGITNSTVTVASGYISAVSTTFPGPATYLEPGKISMVSGVNTLTLTPGSVTGGAISCTGLTSAAAITCASVIIGGTAVIDTSSNGNFASLKIAGTTVVDGSQNGTFAGLTVSGVPRFNTVSTANVSTPSWGTTCPSGYGGTPQTWIEVNANGFVGWVPVF